MSIPIFIASSGEDSKYATDIVSYLRSKDSNVIAVEWWNSFNSGDPTLDRLIEVSSQVMCGLFICMPNDKAKIRNRQYFIPRDNVIFELGLFTSKLGYRNCYLLVGNNVKIPSDWNGITYINATGNPIHDAEKFLKSFLENLKREKTEFAIEIDKILICIDPSLVDNLLKKKTPLFWKQRSLYIGLEGAKGWLNVSNDEQYIRGENVNIFRKARKSLASHIPNIQTFVSFGPGDGHKDNDLINLLTNVDLILYIPIDINESLISISGKKLAKHCKFETGIQADFEDGMLFIKKIIRSKGRGLILFSMLGNTFGNLDIFEEDFLLRLKDIMEKDDFFLLEVTTNISFILDKLKDVNLESINKFESFCVDGIKRQLGHATEVHLAKEVILPESSINNEVPTSIPGTTVIKYSDAISRKVAINIRAYNWSKLISFFSSIDWLALKHSEEYKLHESMFGLGVILLQKR